MRTAPSSPPPSCVSCTAVRASHLRARSSPTAASASAPATPGSCSKSCSVTPPCATTTAPGPNGAPPSVHRLTTRPPPVAYSGSRICEGSLTSIMTKRRIVLLSLLSLLATLLSLFPGNSLAQSAGAYELWVVDQADAANGGSKRYVYGANQPPGNALTAQP